jgi:hypothetical protein
MLNQNDTKKYDLEERTFQFAKDVRNFIKNLPKSIANTEDGRQVVKSSGSVGANYIEANESLSRKDLVMREKLAGKKQKKPSIGYDSSMFKIKNIWTDQDESYYKKQMSS